MDDVSRIENFNCPYCGQPTGTFIELRNHVMVTHRNESPRDSDGPFRLLINGHQYIIRMKPEWTLHEVLHDVLGLTGTKTFCNRGICSSCTVIVDDRPVLSCMTLGIECDYSSVVTIEGIARDHDPLIESYIKHNAMQCGYCTPGFIVTARALLNRVPNPSLEEIKAALEGNLCRCGTYPQHPKAVQEAAVILQGNKNE